STSGFRLVLDPPVQINDDSATFDVARALAGAYRSEGAEGAADVLARSERAPDDQQIWAVVGQLVAQLPAADTIAKSLAAVQRNAGTIKNLAKGLALAKAEATSSTNRTLFEETR